METYGDLRDRYNDLDREAGKYNRPEFDAVYDIIADLVKDRDDAGDRGNSAYPLVTGDVIDEALRKAGFADDEIFVSDFKKYREIEQQAREIQNKAFDKAMQYKKEGLSTDDAMQKAGFVKSSRLQTILDNVIDEAKKENPYFPRKAPFACIEKDDESIDALLMGEKYDIKACLLTYYRELEQYGINTVFRKANYDIKGMFEVLKSLCIYISDNTDKPIHVQNKIIDILKLLDESPPGFTQVLQMLILLGLIKWFENCTINEGDKGYTEAKELCRFVCEKFMHVCVYYYRYFDKNDDSLPLDRYLATNEMYKYLLSKGSMEPDMTTDKRSSHFTRQFTADEANKLFSGLINGGFLHRDTIFSHFLYAFGGTIPDCEKPFKPLKWIKTNSTTKGITPNKKSLLDFLVLLGIPETEIKNRPLINGIFEIPNGTEFRANNYTNITDASGNLKQFESEYHAQLVEIVRKSKENQDL
jgi:hypothetical protein